MTKTERLNQELNPVISHFLENNNASSVIDYVASNSGLPGKRANLELAYVLSDLSASLTQHEKQKMFNLFHDWIYITPENAPVNDPLEFLPFCGIHGIGKLGSVERSLKDKALECLRSKSNDPRWRVREAVCMGLQFMMDKYPEFVIDNFNTWLADKNYLELRAIVTAYANPELLKREIISQNGLKTHRKIFEIVRKSEDRSNGNFKVLRKALGFTFSLIAAVYTPNSFGVMKKLIKLNDKDINWIIRENIKKNRLIKNFPERVKTIENLLINK